jgi:hypothetical protein
MNLFSYGDFERWLIIGLIILSTYLLWSNKCQLYDNRTKLLLSIPRVYLIFYELVIIFDVYTINGGFSDLVKTGIGGVYGLLILFGVETYVRWVNKKYGRH